MAFIDELIEENNDIWQQYLNHPFVVEMANGTLDIEKYRYYLIQDTLYLKEFGRVYAYALYHSKTLKMMRYFYEMLSIVQKNEAYSRIVHLKELGEDIEDIENQLPAKENAYYTDYLLDIAHTGDVVEVLAASLPCMVGYLFIAKHYVKKDPTVLNHHFYGCWFNDYSNENYTYYCKRWADLFNSLTQEMNKTQKEHLQTIFRECSKHELYFWNMVYQGGNENV